jgi:SAM-dependent methyltransferase
MGASVRPTSARPSGGPAYARRVDERTAANRAHWDDRVPIHVASRFYDVEGWLAEGRGPGPWEVDVLGDVDGLDLVHLQCHFGLDTLSWARAGARVTGVDLSAAAIREAAALAARAGLAERARFVEADVLGAAAALRPDTFDVVYVSLGSLCWLPSVARWAAQVAALLRPGGRLFLHDGHPLAWALADDELRVEHPYFEEAEPHVDDTDRTYTDGGGRLEHPQAYEWNHGLGEVVTALLERGLVVEHLTEHDWTSHPRFPWLVQVADQRWAPPPGTLRVPLSFTLLARRPAS